MWFAFIIIFYILEHICTLLLIVLGLLLIGLIVQNIEIACIVFGIVSVIISSLCYSYITDYCFGKKIIGLLVGIGVTVFFYLTVGFCGWLLVLFALIDFIALYSYSTCEECEPMAILLVLASIIVPAIAILT